MIDTDKANFKTLMESSMAIYAVEINVNILKIWWAALKAIPFEHVSQSFSRYIQDPKVGRFAPKPADIISIYDMMLPDGRLGPEEAWALYPHNEWASAVITNEIAEAMQVAHPLIKVDDMIGARMAFKEAYNRITTQNKFNGVAPKWFPSLGMNPEGREPALKEAMEKGRISQEYYLSLAPPKIDNKLIESVRDIQLLTDKSERTPEQLEHARKRMDEIKALLRDKSNVVL